MESKNRFKNSPIHDKEKIISLMDELTHENMIQVVDLIIKLTDDSTIKSLKLTPSWLTPEIRKQVKELWDTPNINNSNPRVHALNCYKNQVLLV